MAMTFSAAPNFPAKLAIGRATNPSNNALAMPPTKADIKANDWDLSINRYKEVVYDEVTYAAPSVIIQDIKNLQEENKQKLLILEELLK